MRLAAVSTAMCLAQAASGCEAVQALETFATSQTAPEGATCATYLAETGSSGVSCHWEFAFRDAEAQTFAQQRWQSLTACRPGEALGADQPVNHPDSYDLREWSAQAGTYAISVKDKGGLNRTLVFLRFEPR